MIIYWTMQSCKAGQAYNAAAPNFITTGPARTPQNPTPGGGGTGTDILYAGVQHPSATASTGVVRTGG